MRKNLIISTIGKHEDIFKSLKYIIEEKNINTGIYFVSDDPTVKKTYELIKNFNEKKNIQTEKIELIDVEKIDLIIKTLEKSFLKKKIEEVKKEKGKVYLDYTYGTKAMSAGILYYMLKEDLIDEAIYVSGTRDKSGVVVGNYQIFSLIPKRLGIKKYFYEFKKRLNFFDFRGAIEILEYCFSEEDKIFNLVKNLLFYYKNFCEGKFSQLNKDFINNLVKFLPDLQIEGFFYNNQFIKEYIHLSQNKPKRNKSESFKMLTFELMYLHDLVKIYLIKGDYPASLALFVSFLDKCLTFKMIKEEIKDENLIFSEKDNNFLIKNRVKEGKMLPAGVSYKLEFFLKLNRNFYQSFQELVQKRNISLFGHGFYFPTIDDGKKIINSLNIIINDLRFTTKFNNFFFYYPREINLPITP